MALGAVQVLRIDLGQATVVIKWCATKSQGLMVEPQCLLEVRQGFQGEGRTMNALLSVVYIACVIFFIMHNIYFQNKGFVILKTTFKSYLTRIINKDCWNKGRAGNPQVLHIFQGLFIFHMHY